MHFGEKPCQAVHGKPFKPNEITTIARSTLYAMRSKRFSYSTTWGSDVHPADSVVFSERRSVKESLLFTNRWHHGPMANNLIRSAYTNVTFKLYVIMRLLFACLQAKNLTCVPTFFAHALCQSAYDVTVNDLIDRMHKISKDRNCALGSGKCFAL